MPNKAVDYTKIEFYDLLVKAIQDEFIANRNATVVALVREFSRAELDESMSDEDALALFWSTLHFTEHGEASPLHMLAHRLKALLTKKSQVNARRRKSTMPTRSLRKLHRPKSVKPSVRKTW